MIDTHAHLTEEVYNSTRKEMIDSFVDNGLEKVFTVAYDIHSSVDCVKLAEEHDNIYAIIGVHPENCREYNEETRQQLKDLAKSNKVIAIGEIGLDYHYEGYDKELQRQVFVDQIKLAHELQLPIVIHLRDAVADLIAVLQQHKEWLKYGVLVHCFSESIESYQILEKLGCYVAFGGVVTFKNARRLQEVATYVPLDKMVLETDCPYLAPTPYRGQLNQPKYVRHVAEKIAELKNCTVEEVIEATTRNAYHLFARVK